MTPSTLTPSRELYLRLPIIPGWLALVLGVTGLLFSRLMRYNLSFPAGGLIILALGLFGLRRAYSRLAL